MWQRTQNPPPLKACRFDSDLGHHLNIRFGQGQVTAATESNSIQSDLISGRIPPLSHPLVERLPVPGWSVGSCARTALPTTME
jgi:hypothetical protein